jgi:hypothetical protein
MAGGIAKVVSRKSRSRKWEQGLQLVAPNLCETIPDRGANPTDYSAAFS